MDISDLSGTSETLGTAAIAHGIWSTSWAEGDNETSVWSVEYPRCLDQLILTEQPVWGVDSELPMPF